MSNERKNNDEIDLLELLGVLWQHKWVIFFAVLMGGLLAYAYLRVAPKVYQANLLLKVEAADGGIGTAILGDLENVLGATGSSKVETQIEILKSRAILGQTVEQFHLGEQLERRMTWRGVLDPPKAIPRSQIVFRLTMADELANRRPQLTLHVLEERRIRLYDDDRLLIEGLQGETLQGNGYVLFYDSNIDMSGEVMAVTLVSRLSAIARLKERLSIKNIDKSSLLELSLTDSDPSFAIDLLNNIADNYVQRNTEESIGKLAQGVSFIEEQLPVLRKQLEVAENALSVYQADNATIDLSAEGASLIKSLAEIEVEQSKLELKADELRTHYTANHPSLQTISRQRAALSERRREIEGRLGNVPQSAQGVLRLKRDVEVRQAIYLQLLGKLQELKVIKASSVSGVKIIDPAQSSGYPIKPKKSLILAMAIVVGALLASFAVLLRHLMNSRIVTIEAAS